MFKNLFLVLLIIIYSSNISAESSIVAYEAIKVPFQYNYSQKRLKKIEKSKSRYRLAKSSNTKWLQTNFLLNTQKAKHVISQAQNSSYLSYFRFKLVKPIYKKRSHSVYLRIGPISDYSDSAKICNYLTGSADKCHLIKSSS